MKRIARTVVVLVCAGMFASAAVVGVCGCAFKSDVSYRAQASAREVRWAPEPSYIDYVRADEADRERRERVLAGGNEEMKAFPAMSAAGPTEEPAAAEGPSRELLVSRDEVWIIATTDRIAPPPDDDHPGCGALLARRPGDARDVPVPLEHTDVRGDISGYIATVEVTQRFHNPYASKIEAKYVFPLPQNAAINEFIMTVGTRRIRGIIRERQEAERIYQEARRQGYVASLLTQERPNIFTQAVANIEPGKRIDINIKYFNTLAYVDGWHEFVFPMVVGPRFNPSGSMGGVGAVGRGSRGASGQATEVQYLRPHERSGHDVALAITIDAGTPIHEIRCQSHAVEKIMISPQKAEITLARRDTVPNKDFVLRYKVAGEETTSALLTHADQRGTFFTLMLYPPESLSFVKRTPMEMVFVLDCSGSMNGRPIAQAREAVGRALRHLQPADTFQIIRFSNDASQLGGTPLAANKSNIDRGLRYLHSLRADGGTMMIEGIKAALDFPHDPRRFRFVTFLTDGYIGNDQEVLAEMHRRLGSSRVFSFGIGSSVNRHLMTRMAALGRGAVAYVGLDDEPEKVMDRFFDRVTRPALTDIRIDWGGMRVSDVYPKQIPDLFVGRPVILTGRYEGDGPAQVRVKGKLAGERRELLVHADPGAAGGTHAGIPFVWARAKISNLANLAVIETDPGLPKRIRRTALEYGLVSAYTAFLAVDSLTRTAGGYGTTLAVPVPVPDGVLYETTVGP